VLPRTLILLLILPVALLGCAGTSPGKFIPTTERAHYVLSDDTEYVALKANAFHPEVINGLKSGVYKPLFEDAQAIYYLGPERCVLPFQDNGGFLIPRAGSDQAPRIWVYIRDDSEWLRKEAGLLIAELSGLEAGRIRVFNTSIDPALVAKLTRVPE
jgi:hypothetical protein